MTTQEAYERMRIYLTRPGARQAKNKPGPEGMCMYETVIDGAPHRCAVGCLLAPDTIETCKHDSGVTVVPLVRSYPLAARDLAGVDNLNFLSFAQLLHDDELNWPDGKFDVLALDRLAAEHGLRVVRDEAVKEQPLVPEEVPVLA